MYVELTRTVRVVMWDTWKDVRLAVLLAVRMVVRSVDDWVDSKDARKVVVKVAW